jgi:uncharacterized protein YggU (UPF0235/DUF167 family)
VELKVAAHPEGAVVDVWVVPGAARTEVAGLHDGAVRVRVAAAPERGRANAAAAALVAEAAGGRRGRVVAGAGSRRKRVLVEGVAPGEARDRLMARVTGT